MCAMMTLWALYVLEGRRLYERCQEVGRKLPRGHLPQLVINTHVVDSTGAYAKSTRSYEEFENSNWAIG